MTFNNLLDISDVKLKLSTSYILVQSLFHEGL